MTMTYQIKKLMDSVEASTEAYNTLEHLQTKFEGVKDVIIVLEDGTVYTALGDAGRIAEQGEDVELPQNVPLDESHFTPVVSITGTVNEWGLLLQAIRSASRMMLGGSIPAPVRELSEVSLGMALLVRDDAFVDTCLRGGTLELDEAEWFWLRHFIAIGVAGLIEAIPVLHGGLLDAFCDRIMQNIPEEDREAFIKVIEENHGYV